MALDPTPIVPVNDPNSLVAAHANSKVYPPLATTTTLANDVGSGEQILRNQTHTLNETKVDRDGDTMTDTLVITTSTANQPALNATGNGTGSGIVATGGATGKGAEIQAGGGNNIGAYCAGAGTGPGVSALGGATGSGVVALAGGGNNYGVDATGTGTASGITAMGGATGNGAILTAGGGNAHGAACTGAGTGAGIIANPGTAQTNVAPTPAGHFAGYIDMTGADPTPTTDPGANNALHGASIIKAWATLDDTYTIRDGYNVASVTTVLGDVKRFTFVRPMLDNKYGVKIHVHGDVARSGSHNGLAQKNAGDFEFVLYDTTTGTTGLGAIADEIYIEVTGRQ